MKNVTFERNEESSTGETCQESGTYLCDMHPYIEKYLNKGDSFPKCDQKGIPHNTTWNKIINERNENK
jgi:hypothetical protein